MLNTSIPLTLIHWISSFLSVQLFNVFSSSCRFTQGLPQGSVLAPLLFVFYINDLATTLNNDAVIALFADDVSILTTARKREDAEATAQSVVSSVVTWSQEWKLNLNAEKVRYAPSPLRLTTVLGIQLSLLVIKKFVSTPLLVSLV